jgi:hypothetical protein
VPGSDCGQSSKDSETRGWEMKYATLRVHDTTIPHLNFVEKILLDELIRQGKAEIITNMSGKLTGETANGIKNPRN